MAQVMMIQGGGSLGNRDSSAAKHQATRIAHPTAPPVKSTTVARASVAPKSSAPASSGGGSSTGYSYSGSAGGGYGGAGIANVAAAPAIEAPAAPSLSDFLGSDAQYIAQIAALRKALSDYTAGQNQTLSQYDQNYGTTLNRLGYDQSAKKWNWNDLNTTAGASNNNQQNDFASRGMLQSTAYANALDRLQRQFGNQLSDLSTAKQQEHDTINSAISAYKSQYDPTNGTQAQQAKADAAARYAARYGS